MADYGGRTVGWESGTPHYQGESIWDLMRPNPQGEEDIQQELYGMGGIGQDMPSNVTEGRSPFGQMLQGIGLLGPPSPRALTPFEQFTYQRGLHQKGEWDQQTQQQSLENISRKFGLANQVTKQTGGAALPPDVANLFSPNEQQSLATYGQHFKSLQDMSDQQKQVELTNAQLEAKIKQKQLEFGIQDRAEARQEMLDKKRWSQTPVVDAAKEYQSYAEMENKELLAGTLTPDKHSNYATLRNMALTKLRHAGSVFGIPENQLNAFGVDEDFLASVAGQKQQPNQQNLVNSPQGVDQQLQQMGWPQSLQAR